MTVQQLDERLPLLEAAGGTLPKTRRFRVRIIQGDVQGASAYYPAEVLRRDGPRVFRAGTKVYIDHPTVSEASDRPERSIRDLAGRLATDATYDEDGLYAVVEVYPHWAPVIEAMADDIGMSIRASGLVEASRDPRIPGPIVTKLTEAQSVDFVTTPGAGGRIVELLEAARRDLAEKRIWREIDHPRDWRGRFTHKGGDGDGSGGHGGGGGGGRTRVGTVDTSVGPATVTRNPDGSGSITIGGHTLRLRDEREAQAFRDGMSMLSNMSVSRSWQIGTDRTIGTDDGRTLAIATRTSRNTFDLRLAPRDDADRNEIASSPAISLNSRDATAIDNQLSRYDREAREQEQARREVEREARIAAGETNPADVARRAAGKPPSQTGPGERGMPSTIDSRQVNPNVTLHREEGDDYYHLSFKDENGQTRSVALTDAEVDEIVAQVRQSADEDEVDDSRILADRDGFTFGEVIKEGDNDFTVAIDDQFAFSLSKEDADRLGELSDQLSRARRFDNPTYGKVDIYDTGGAKVGIRHLGDDGRPVSIEFDRRSTKAINRALTAVYEGFDQYDDDPDAPTEGLTAKTVRTNHGPVEVRLSGGAWGDPNAELSILPTDPTASWGVIIQGPQMDALWNAWQDIHLSESRRRRIKDGTVMLAEAMVSNKPWSDFSQADYTIEQWRRACLIGPDEPSDRKEDYKLPVREPDGTLNRNAVHAAAARIGQVDAPAPVVKRAARRLVALYRNQLDEEPPESLLRLAGMAPPMREAAARVQAMAEAAGITAMQLRCALCRAVETTYGGTGIWAEVCDWDDTSVVFRLCSTGGDSQLFKQGYSLVGQQVRLTGQPVEVVARTIYEPVNASAPAAPAQPATTPSPVSAPAGEPVVEAAITKSAAVTATNTTEEISTMHVDLADERPVTEAAQDTKTTAEERLEEALRQIADLQERMRKADEYRITVENRETAQRMVTEALRGSGLPEATHPRVAERVLRDLPLAESGRLDAEAFTKRIQEAINDKKAELAAVLEAAGVGRVRGLGESASTEPLSEADYVEQLTESFRRLGMTAEAAKIAANGRA